MPIDTWFPLAIYYADLPEAPQQKLALRQAVLALEASGFEKRNYEGRRHSWRGTDSSRRSLRLAHDADSSPCPAVFDGLRHGFESDRSLHSTSLAGDFAIGRRSWAPSPSDGAYEWGLLHFCPQFWFGRVWSLSLSR